MFGPGFDSLQLHDEMQYNIDNHILNSGWNIFVDAAAACLQKVH